MLPNHLVVEERGVADGEACWLPVTEQCSTVQIGNDQIRRERLGPSVAFGLYRHGPTFFQNNPACLLPKVNTPSVLPDSMGQSFGNRSQSPP